MNLRHAIHALLHGQPLESCIDSTETVVFFPTAASLCDEHWHIPIHGWIYQPTEFSRLRRSALWMVKRLLRRRIPSDHPGMPLFQQRAALFLADNERGNRVQIRLGDATFTLKRSRANGHFHGLLKLPAPLVWELLIGTPSVAANPASWLSFRAITRSDDQRIFDGRIFLLPPNGLSVISDIDDTIKITEAFDRRKMLHNTFLKDFAVVPHMAALYQHWRSTRDACFHYVSASPWHLYPFLNEFLAVQNFPSGTFHLRDFRLAPPDIHRTLRTTRRVKLRHIRLLLKSFPQRRFLLVGDSGESDPITYATLARQFPTQIEKIYIRDVAPNAVNRRAMPRWQKALSKLPPDKFQIFTDPTDIRET